MKLKSPLGFSVPPMKKRQMNCRSQRNCALISRKYHSKGSAPGQEIFSRLRRTVAGSAGATRSDAAGMEMIQENFAHVPEDLLAGIKKAVVSK